MTIGENIRYYRKQRGMTIKQLGEKCGINEGNMGNYERGKRNPKIQTLKRIADALGVPIGVLDQKYAWLYEEIPYSFSMISTHNKEDKMKQIYAFDFDGTLVNNAYPKIGEPVQEVINFAKRVKEQGNYIILWTMREDNLLDDAVNYCRSQGIEFDAINDNLPHMKEFFKNNPRKVFANYYIDDHNAFFPTLINAGAFYE